MRVLHLLASPYWSGPAENVALLAAEQRALGHEATVAVDRKRTRTTAEELAVPRLSGLGLLDEGGLELSVKSSPVGWWSDFRSLRRREVDVLHAHFTHDHLLARWARRPPVRLVRSLHAQRSLVARLPRADAFTVPYPVALAAAGGAPVQVLPALVPPHFVPGERALLRAQLGLAGAPLIGMVSTFQASRRHRLALSAFAALRAKRPEAVLVLAGDGALEGELRQAVTAEGLDAAVRFTGYLAGEAYLRLLQALDEVWILGLGNDWSARAAAQARACGVRVVAVAEGALPLYADALVDAPTPERVVAASLQGARTSRPRASNREIAHQILALYQRCGAA